LATLIVVAHPDDEVLGCGGFAAGIAASGELVRACILSVVVEARRGRPDQSSLESNIRDANSILGISEPMFGDFPNIKFNTVPHLQLVQFIESALVETAATTLLTHHPEDLNDDHRHVSLACQAAARLFQRRPDIPELRQLLFMETLSSTDWAFSAGRHGFRPTAFYPLGDDLLARKLRALRAYVGVIREFPHPRSEEIVTGLAAFRGGQAGVRYAEAFELAFLRLDSLSR